MAPPPKSGTEVPVPSSGPLEAPPPDPTLPWQDTQKKMEELQGQMGAPSPAQGAGWADRHKVLYGLLSLVPGFQKGYQSRTLLNQQAQRIAEQHRQNTLTDQMNLLRMKQEGQISPVDEMRIQAQNALLRQRERDSRLRQAFLEQQKRDQADYRNKMLELEKQRLQNAGQKKGGGLFGGTIPPDEIDPMAALVAQGTPPQTVAPFSPTARAQVVSRAVQMIQKESGVSMTEAAKIYQKRQAGFHGRMNASGRLSGQTALLGGFEKSAENIMKNVNTPAYEALSSHLTGSPLANRSILWMRDEVMGDPAARNWISTLTTLRGEVAKIVSGSLGVAASSDEARREAARIIPDGISPKQFASLMPVIRKELQQRIAGPTRVLQDITGGSYPGISSDPSVSSGTSPEAPSLPSPIGQAPPGIPDGPISYKGQRAIVKDGMVYAGGGG